MRTSTELWNAYQRARYSVVRESLLTQDFRLTGSPYFGERFAAAAAGLANALATVELTGRSSDRTIAVQVLATNEQIDAAIQGLIDAVNAGDAARADRIATRQLGPLFATAIAAVDRGAAAHRAESKTGLHAAERAEIIILVTAGGIFVLGILLIGTTVVALRFRRRLDRARRSELDRLKAAALTDSLTEALNHRAFHEQFAEALTASTDSGAPVSLVMIDLDGLKEINDRSDTRLVTSRSGCSRPPP